MLCPHCQAENSADALQCVECGRGLRPDQIETAFMDSSAPAGPVSAGGRVTTASASHRSSENVSISMEPGTDFGPRYRIECLIGEGGMGQVYKAYDMDLGRVVALKLVRPELASHQGAMQRFKQELLLASRISHRNILRIHDLGEVNGVKFISMACVEGQDLHDIMAKAGRLSVDRAVNIARQICSALEAAHREGIVHRDLKPANILIDSADNVYVSDFGLARSLEAGVTMMTATGQILGTPRYMSPEQVEAKIVDQRSDLYSFGLILCEMLTGAIPFRSESTLQIMYERVNQKPASPKSLNPDIPDRLEQIILRCLEKDPNLRYQQASQILADLEAGQTSAHISRLHVAARPSRLRRRLPLAIGAICLLLVIAVMSPPGRRMLVRVLPRTATGLPGSSAPVASPQKYLALLPFRVPGDDASLKYEAEGMVEALSAKLFQLQDVHVASPTAVEAAAKQDSLRKVAHYLGVKLLVVGTMQKSADRIETIVRLEDPDAGRTLWTHAFQFLPADLLVVEDEMYQKLVAALGIKLTNEELAHGAGRPTEDIDAYGLYLRARSIIRGQRDLKNVGAAIDMLNQAVLKDPRFALAYAGLCDLDLVMYDLTKDPRWPEKALGAGDQAQRVNASLPEVHVALGSAYKATGRTAEAIAELKRAVELAPNSDEGYRRLASTYADAGRMQEALQMFRKAMEVNPYYWINHNQLGAAYMKLAQYDKAAEEFRRVTQLEPERATGYTNLGVAYYQAGKWDECIPAFEKSIALSPSFFAYNNLAVIYTSVGRYRDAIGKAQKAVEMSPNQYSAMGNLADAYRAAGQKDEALASYNKAIALAFKAFQVNSRDSAVLGDLALYYGKKGDSAKATQFIRRARSIDPQNVSLAYKQAVVYALAGKQTEAWQSLKEALQKGYSFKEVENNPDLKEVRNLPEFQKLLSEAGRKP